MKRYLRYILMAALTLGFAACQEEEWAPGERDFIDCQGIFFPQEQATDYVLSPGDKMELTFTVERAEADDEAFVPYEIVSSVEDFFFLEEETIYFDEDQTKASFKVYVSDEYELGEKYSCTIKVTDPQYVSQYALSSSELSFSVTVVGWEYVGKGYWRDDLFAGFAAAIGAVLTEPNHEKEVEIYQRADLPGYYMIESVYTKEFVSYMADGDEENASAYEKFCPAYPIYLNAVNPNKVYFDLQFAFFDPSGQYGDIYLASDVDETMGAGYSAGLYGTLKNGVITFPKNGLIAYVPAAGGMAYANTSGKHRIVLPGYQPTDYSIDVDYAPAENGVLPVKFTLGPDVAKVGYQVYEGHLNDVEMVSRLEEVKAGKNVKEVTASGVYDFTAEKSAFYTLIACSFDASGAYQEYDVIKFGYDTADDPKEVDIHMGLIVSDKHTPIGLTAENSMEYYIYGTDIIEARAAIFKKVQYEDFKENIEYNVKNAPSYALDRYQLDTLNKYGYSGLVNGLTPGVEYSLIVYADNGYHSGFFTATATTEGVFDIMEAEYDIFDIPERLQPQSHDAYLDKQWQIMSLDPYKATKWGRTDRGEATFKDKIDVMYDKDGNITKDPAKADYIMDYISLEGMNPNLAAKGLKDAIDFEYYEGFIYTLMTQMPSFEYEGVPVYPTNCYLYFNPMDGSLSPFLENGAMIGGFLTEDQDVIAFISNPQTQVGMAGFSYVGMQLCYFAAQDYSGDGYLFEEDAHAYPMLVAADSKYASASPAEVSKLSVPQAAKAVSVELQKGRRNLVETESGYVKSTIDFVRNSMPYNYMQNSVSAVVVRDVEAAEFTMTPSSSSFRSTVAEPGFVERVIRK